MCRERERAESSVISVFRSFANSRIYLSLIESVIISRGDTARRGRVCPLHRCEHPKKFGVAMKLSNISTNVPPSVALLTEIARIWYRARSGHTIKASAASRSCLEVVLRRTWLDRVQHRSYVV